jgi:hypothetical protein
MVASSHTNTGPAATTTPAAKSHPARSPRLFTELDCAGIAIFLCLGRETVCWPPAITFCMKLCAAGPTVDHLDVLLIRFPRARVDEFADIEAEFCWHRMMRARRPQLGRDGLPFAPESR